MTGAERNARRIRFGEKLAPTREYADEWEAEFPRRFVDYIDAYRQRVATYWPQLVAAYPEAFRLAGPVEVVAVATLAALWVFARPSPNGADTVRAVGLWEHPELATWDVQSAPPEHQHRRTVEVALGGDKSYSLLYRYLLAGHTINLDRPQWLPGWMWLESFNTADEDALLAQAMSREIDRAALGAARADLDTIRNEPNAQKRGTEFERIVVDVLSAHGAKVERGQLGSGEQVDVFILRPFFALLECRWRKKPVDPRDINDLIVKLSRRPPIVAGLYASMSGFTTGARTQASASSQRTVVLVSPDDLTLLLAGDVTLAEWWHERVSELVKRYPERAESKGGARRRAQGWLG